MSTNRPVELRERVFEFSCNVVTFSCELSKNSGVVREIAWQLAAAAGSAGANLEEAKAAYSRREFAAKNSISLKEMRETLYWLRVIRRCKLAPKETVQPLLLEADELVAMLTAGMKKLRPVRLILLTLLCSVVPSSYF